MMNSKICDREKQVVKKKPLMATHLVCVKFPLKVTQQSLVTRQEVYFWAKHLGMSFWH